MLASCADARQASSVPVFGDLVSDASKDSRLSDWTSRRDDRVVATRMFSRFCDDVSVDVGACDESIRKLLVVSQKNVCIRSAFEGCFVSGAFIDWDRVERIWADRPYQDSFAWVQLLDFVKLGEPDAWRALCKEHHVIRHFDECMRAAGLVVDDLASVALYLLVNVRPLHTLHAVELFYSTRFRRGVRAEALVFFSEIANKQFDRESQTRALVGLMRTCVRIESMAMSLELELLKNQALELDDLFRQKMVRAMVGRPKLRSKLNKAGVGASGAAQTLFSMDDIEHWCGYIRFPNVFSMKQRRRLYFVMAQCHMDVTTFMPYILVDKELCQSVQRYPVKQPDAHVLHECITDMRVVSDPFPELHQFRARCFDSFAQEHKSRLRLNDLLHLYTAAYQEPSVWKSVWKLIFPVLSIQIIRDVEAFVGRVPFASLSVLSIMFVGVAFPPDVPGLMGVSISTLRGGDADSVLSVDTASFRLGTSDCLLTPRSEFDVFVAPSPGDLIDLVSCVGLTAEVALPHSEDDNRVVGESSDAVDGVRDAESAGVEGGDERLDVPAPLQNQVLGRAEPPVVYPLISLQRGDAALALPVEAEEVVDKYPWDALLHKEAGAECGVGRTLVGQIASGVRCEAHVDLVHVNQGVVHRSD